MASNSPISERGRLTKHDVRMLGWRSLFNQSAMNYERMQADGWTLAMLPSLRKIYGNDKEGLAAALESNLQFINTNNYAAPLLMGLEASLEEHGEKRSTIDGLRIALFGPLAGIGDAITWFTILPIVAGITASFAKQGRPISFFPSLFSNVCSTGANCIIGIQRRHKSYFKNSRKFRNRITLC